MERYINSKYQRIASREGVDITTTAEIDKYFIKHIWETAGSKEELFFTYFKDKTFTHYIKVNFYKVGRSLYRKFFNTPRKIEKYYNEGENFLKELEKTADEYKRRIKNNKDLRIVIEAFKELRKQYNKINHIYSITSFIAIEAWQSDFERILDKLIRENNLEKRRDLIAMSLAKPWKKTAIYNLQKDIEKKLNINKIIKKYQFLRSWSIIWYRKIDKNWIKSITKVEEKRNYYSLKKIFNLLKPNLEERHFLRLSPYIIFFKDYRDDLRRKHVYKWVFLFEHIARELGINYNDLGYLTLEEIEESLKGNQTYKDMIDRRKNNPCIITNKRKDLKIRIIDSKIPKKYKEVLEQVNKQKKNLVIKGIVAQKGRVEGLARIIRNYHDIKRVKKGEILVANTTHPNYLPAMQKAIGFITNEGGIASHAAIVAREMKKPCIVGTKLATSILQDGDRIRVDAEKGIVRKLK